ncbi:TPR domain-containing protein [[Leptolyngbya] sp. PCC 7376]|uniref:tetratricopeptide repeat protein n=1 Tax=[Leptolyngbya] sp. PCC 7376 TaxID=111781 RepID=UPI00029F47B5|nr:tetratricopeptide repeat protein [[Leptolyngbya] sp. PCC 7376]AFY37506.1 TPR domain-containing protein [[Leptolyngbya] sp. PCC 7376]
MTSKVVEKYYRPHPWVYGVSGLFFLMAGILLFLPKFDQWVMEKRIAAATEAQLNETVEDPAIATLEKEAQSYEVWLQKEPKNERALRGLIDAQLQLGNISGAVAPLDTLAQLNQNNDDYAILLGQVKQKAKDYEGAAAEFKKILFVDATHTKALQGMVDLMLEQNRPEGAIGLLQQTLKDMGKPKADQTIEIDPEKVTSIQLMLGQVYVDQERNTEAIAIYDQAASINKTDFRPVLAKAMVLKNQGKDTQAKPLFTTAVTLAPAKYRDQIKEMAVFDQTELEVIEAAEETLVAPSTDAE